MPEYGLITISLTPRKEEKKEIAALELTTLSLIPAIFFPAI